MGEQKVEVKIEGGRRLYNLTDLTAGLVLSNSGGFYSWATEEAVVDMLNLEFDGIKDDILTLLRNAKPAE